MKCKNIKKIVLLLLSIISLNTFSQKKDLSLSDAVLGYYKGMYPENLRRLQFISDTEYMYLDNDKYLVKNVVDLDYTSEISLTSFQKKYADLKRFPRFLAFDKTVATFTKDHAIIKYDYKNNAELLKLPFDEKAQNTDFNSVKNSLAYTIDNNLYIATTDNPKIAITNLSDKNIVSGQAIARYEFGISKGTFWSPNGNYLAFYQKDETNVTNYPLVDITTYPATVNEIKYPMAGQGSEIAKIGIYNLEKNKTIYLDIDTSDEHYLTNLSWSPDEKYVLVAEVNRAQNHMDFNLYKTSNGKKVRTLFTEKNDRWVEPENDAVFIPNNKTEFIWLSERNGFKNAYIYSIKGKLKKQLTDFKFPIKSILGFDKSGENIILSATGKDGRETHAYKVNVKYGDITKITSKKGTHRAILRGNYLIDTYTSLEIPREISTINLIDGTEEYIFAAKNPLENYKIGKTEFVTLKSEDNFDLYARIIKPADFDYSKKYPVLIYVYGGTHAQLVTNSWLGGASLWMQQFATDKQYIVFTLDNRGSENRGFAFESIIHRKAGEAGIADQMKGVDYLKSFPYVDKNRIAVHGWSYGGFMTCSLLLRQPNAFTVGVAGGPVTDWKYYEVMYGERYMDTPQENTEGYANARLGKYLENLKGNLLLIHGSVDPTVVPQHSMTLLKEAVDKGVQIDFFTYPMHPHNVRGKDRVHLMQKVLDYIVEKNN